MLVPVLMTGAIALMIRNFPVESFLEFIRTANGGIIDTILVYIYDSTFGFMSAYLVLTISYYYSFTFSYNNFSLQVMNMIASLCCFLASFGGASGSLELAHFGPVGVFTAIISAILSTKLFYTFYGLINRKANVKLLAADIDYRSSILAIVPLIACIVVFIAINLLINMIFDVSNFNDLISMGLSNIFTHMSSDLLSGIVYVLVLNLLWFFGIHGGNALEAVAREVFVPANTDPSLIVSKNFLDSYALIGGCGATMCLLVAILAAAKSKNNRRLAYTAAPALAFNINEPLVYGFPIVLNPVLFIPFLLVPVVSLIIGYTATHFGWMPVLSDTDVIWTTPPFVSGYMLTGSASGAVVQAVIIAAGALIYIPFVRFSEKLQLMRETTLVNELTEIFKENMESSLPYYYLQKHDDIGMLARSMVARLRADIAADGVDVHYMPQHDATGKVTGAEALLRWSFANTRVFPPLAVALAQEDKLFDELTSCIIRRVSRDMKKLKKQTNANVHVSVNISAEELNDRAFIENIVDIVKRDGIADNIVLEITEDSSIMYFDKTTENIDYLHENGLGIAIDDFSMGQTSLKYLQTNHFDYVKLDGSLVQKIDVNSRSRDIIESIINLGHSLGFSIVAEYVENEAIREALLDLGCQFFQGYLFSPAIPADKFIDYYQVSAGNSCAIPSSALT